VHLTNVDELDGGAFALTPYFVTGVLWGWVAWHKGSRGMHVANNVVLALILGNEGDVNQTVCGLTLVLSDFPAWTFVWTDLSPTLLTESWCGGSSSAGPPAWAGSPVPAVRSRPVGPRTRPVARASLTFGR
jgi:hypothetical protein